jgi:quercetin dioxygenase-like cupin family protein
MMKRRKGMTREDGNPARESLVARPFTYTELVDYQEGSIVSRTIIDKPAGTITLFAFDKGQNLSEHTAPYDALVEVIEGTGTITIEGKDHEVRAGQQIIMPADRPHAVEARERFKMVLVMIRAK